ncbi:MAG: hypothetical protein KatS3mg105_3206 [Gemmatales bacterium]|nr:MAG: hypothetical protein KatS3mg105_3206 [Gemmatales bacterium]
MDVLNSKAEPVAIIGIGCLFPKADNLAEFWANICRGTDTITEVPPTHWRAEDYFDPDPKAPDRVYTARGAFLSPVEFPALEFGISPNTLEATDTTQLLGLLAARQALEDAGYGSDRNFDRRRVSVILGVTGTLELVIPLGARLGHPIWRRALKEAGVDEATADQVVQKIADSYVSWQENSFPGLLGNVAAGRIANRLDLGGTNCVVDAACASSLGAIHLAMLELQSGRCDMALSGGLDTFNDIFMYTCFSKTPALSPSGDARPFDSSADGTILGEGLGVVVLKRYHDAVRDGDRIYAVIRGIGASSDGKGNAIYAPSASGQSRALRAAYELAGVSPDTIELVEAHGTGTRAGDATELAALNDVYSSVASSKTPRKWCAIGSVKSQIGHTKAAAGVAGLIKAALALDRKVLPPTIKVEKPLDVIEKGPFYVNTEKRPWLANPEHPRRAAVSSFGFGGSNFHCVLEEATSEKTEIDWDPHVEVVAYSADSEAELVAKIDKQPIASWSGLQEHAFQSRRDFDPRQAVRVVAVVERTEDFSWQSWQTAIARTIERRTSQSRKERIFVGRGTRQGQVAFLFSGQGSQYVGMGRDLACRFPVMLEAITVADRTFSTTRGELFERIFPLPAFSPEERSQQAEALKQTQFAQPALAAIEWGMFRILQHFQVVADAAAGHSFGELVALCAAGVFDDASLFRLAVERGRLLAERTENGAMLAVRASLEVVEALIRQEALDVVIANRNAPEQFVLSGTSAWIDRAADACRARGIAATRLSVSAAFHSPLARPAWQPFFDRLKETTFAPPRFPVLANASAAAYPSAADEGRKLLADQLVQPVRFIDVVEKLYEMGCRTFVEIGPGARLCSLVESILGSREFSCVAVDASSGRRNSMADLASVLAELAAKGHSVDLAAWNAGLRYPASTRPAKGSLTFPICGANYVRPKEPAGGNGTVGHRPTLNPKAMNKQNNSVALEAPVPAAPPAANSPATNATSPSTIRQDMMAQNEIPASGISQELLVLQRLGEQTAQLHRQFLDGQDRLLQTIQTLLQNRQTPEPVRSDFVSKPPENGSSDEVPIAQPVSSAAPPKMPQPNQTSGQVPVPTGPDADPEVPPEISTITPHSSSASDDRVRQTLLDVVAEKTGYPAEMLELDMELDADLGIDSIKRVEIFSALQEKLPEAPAVSSEHLGTLRTLRDVVGFLSTAPIPTAGPEANGKNDRLATILLDVVAEKTGYPAEMLELDMELDADLGIDSIKRVEIFSALQEKLPDAPAVSSEHLGTLRTLRDVAVFLDATGGNQSPPLASPTTSPDFAKALLDIVAEKTGYPAEMLELDMELDADLGIDSIKRVEIFSAMQERMPEAPAISSEQIGQLRTLRHVVDFLAKGSERVDGEPSAFSENGAIEAPADETATPLNRYVLSKAPLPADRPELPLPELGEIVITDDGEGVAKCLAARLDGLGLRTRVVSLDEARLPSHLTGLVLISPRRCGDDFIKKSFVIMQKAGPGLIEKTRSGTTAFLVTVSRFDGAFGLGSATGNATSGGLAGLAKTAQHEWPAVRCKAIDLSASLEDVEDVAMLLADEIFRAGPLEVGIDAAGRYGLDLVQQPQTRTDDGPLRAGDLVVITGGGRGVTAEAALALAETFSPAMLLLGRSPLPEAEPEWLAGLTEERDVKQAIMAQATKKLTPREVDDHCRRVFADRELARNLERFRRAGARVVYRSVDVCDAAAVRDALRQASEQFGPVRAVVHGAGVLADRRIEDKTTQQFDLVYDTKVLGLKHVLEAIDERELKALVLFSSSTARFGRMGQADYAAANEVLNKWAQQLQRRWPHCRVRSINWGPWDGGMVTSALKNLFASEGVGVIPLRAGARWMIGELQAEHNDVETVVLAGTLADFTHKTENAFSPKVPEIVSAPAGIVFERDLSVASHPVLQAHVIDGKAVLPVCLIVEWLAHGALHNNPGLFFTGLEDLRILKGIRLRGEETIRLQAVAEKPRRSDDQFVVPVEIRSLSDGRHTPSARAMIVLSTTPLPALPTNGFNTAIVQAPKTLADAYETLLFHGPEFQGMTTIESCSEQGITAWSAAAAKPSVWMQHPLRSNWLADPLVLDVAFQMLIVWCWEQHRAPSLPVAIGRYRQHRRAFPPDGVRIQARVTRTAAARVFAHIEFISRTGELVAEMDDYECVMDEALVAAFRRNRIAVEMAHG